MIRIPLTPAQYREKSAEILAKEGLSIDPKGGVLSREGVVLAYSYDGAEFTATVLHHPFLVPESVIESRISGWLTG